MKNSHQRLISSQLMHGILVSTCDPALCPSGYEDIPAAQVVTLHQWGCRQTCCITSEVQPTESERLVSYSLIEPAIEPAK